jgi:TIR domain
MAGPIPPGAGRIFISYRREETSYPAAWLYDRLAQRFGSGQVFKDVDSIQLGDDFVEVIHRAVGSCDVLLALIGDQWLTITDRHGRRRLDNPDDFVRLEIEAALTRNVRVIPILVEDAPMPRPEELPESLTRLVRRQALELSPERFEFDTNRLLRVLESTLDEVRRTQGDMTSPAAPVAPVTSDGAPPQVQGGRPEGTPRARPTRTWVLAGAGVAVALVVVAAAVVLANLRTTPAGGSIKVDPSSVTSGDRISLSGLTAVSDPDPPAVGGAVTVSYSLTNVGDAPVQLKQTFVGARNQARDNRDFGESNQGRTLQPGEAVDVQGQLRLDSAGRWQLWPCYELTGGGACPDEWQAFTVTVG